MKLRARAIFKDTIHTLYLSSAEPAVDGLIKCDWTSDKSFAFSGTDLEMSALRLAFTRNPFNTNPVWSYDLV